MRAILQRVSEAEVRVDGTTVGRIGRGWLVLLGVGHGDAEAEARKMAEKVARLRLFDDAEGKFNLSVMDVGGEALVVSQFTLYADTSRGRRPSFVGAADPKVAAGLVDRFADLLREYGIKVEMGRFGAHMDVRLHNDGPVTVSLCVGEEDTGSRQTERASGRSEAKASGQEDEARQTGLSRPSPL